MAKGNCKQDARPFNTKETVAISVEAVVDHFPNPFVRDVQWLVDPVDLARFAFHNEEIVSDGDRLPHICVC